MIKIYCFDVEFEDLFQETGCLSHEQVAAPVVSEMTNKNCPARH